VLTPEKAHQVDQTVTTIIYGGTNVIATGQSSVNSTINQQTIANGDWEHLANVLHHSGLPKSKVADLKEAIDADGKKTIGAKVSEWIKNTAPEVLAGGVKIGTAAAQSVLTEWLRQYFGM
jgi:hypothetical protein